MSGFKIGDRVKSPEGWLGTVVLLDAHVGVRHDDHKEHLHDLCGRCESGHGWWYFSEDLTKLKSYFRGNI